MTRPFATIGFAFSAALAVSSLLGLNGSLSMAVVCFVFCVFAGRPPAASGGRIGSQKLLAALLAAAAAFFHLLLF